MFSYNKYELTKTLSYDKKIKNRKSLIISDNNQLVKAKLEELGYQITLEKQDYFIIQHQNERNDVLNQINLSSIKIICEPIPKSIAIKITEIQIFFHVYQVIHKNLHQQVYAQNGVRNLKLHFSGKSQNLIKFRIFFFQFLSIKIDINKQRRGDQIVNPQQWLQNLILPRIFEKSNYIFLNTNDVEQASVSFFIQKLDQTMVKVQKYKNNTFLRFISTTIKSPIIKNQEIENNLCITVTSTIEVSLSNSSVQLGSYIDCIQSCKENLQFNVETDINIFVVTIIAKTDHAIAIFNKLSEINLTPKFIEETMNKQFQPKQHHLKHMNQYIHTIEIKKLNESSQFLQIKLGLKIQTNEYKIINEQIAKSDFVELYRLNYHKIFKDIKFKLSNWKNIYKRQYEIIFRQFRNLVIYKTHKFKIVVPYLYPKINQLLDSIKNAVDEKAYNRFDKQFQKDKQNHQLSSQIKKIKQQFEIAYQEKTTEILFLNYIQNVNSGKLQNIQILDKQKQIRKNINDYINSYEGYKKQKQIWQTLYGLVRIIKEQQAKQQDSTIQKKIKFNQQFLRQINKERLPNITCFGCIQFLYINVNISDLSINQTPLKTFRSIVDMKEYQVQIKNTICAMLNTVGGVILFNCDLYFLQIIPRGQKLNKKDMQKYDQSLRSILSCFYPAPNNRIQIDFIPLVQNPFYNSHKNQIQKYPEDEKILKRKSTYFKREYIKDLFITRIKISPNDQSKTYFWEHNSQSNLLILQTDDAKAIIGAKRYKWMKYKFIKNYISGKISQDECAMIRKAQNVFDHECKIPDIGYRSVQQQQTIQIDEKKIKQFKNISLLIAKHSDHKHILSKLQQKKIQAIITTPYSKHKFKAAKTAAVLHHNIRFESLLKQVSQNKFFSFGGRYVLTITITNFLKIDDCQSISKADFDNLVIWLREHHPEQQLKLWKFENEKQIFEYYLQTENKIALVLMYYVISQYNMKCLFKNPQHLDKLTPQERERRMKIMYQSKNFDKSQLSP